MPRMGPYEARSQEPEARKAPPEGIQCLVCLRFQLFFRLLASGFWLLPELFQILEHSQQVVPEFPDTLDVELFIR